VAREIIVVRHGQTEWSKSGQHTSRTDLPLTDDGRRQAAQLGERLAGRDLPAVLCSPLRRARETCELAGFGKRASIHDELREWDYGDYEGLTTPQIWEQDPDWNLWRDGCPGGETPEQVAGRADSVLAQLQVVDGDALIFAHGHILRVLTARWLQMPSSAGARFALAAGGLGTLAFERKTQVLAGWNEAG
jgi:broad specificity phosphatase PhoE